MSGFWRKNGVHSKGLPNIRRAVNAGLEPLEARQLLHGGAWDGWGGGGFGGFGGGRGFGGQTIAFSLTPAAVQNGLDSLAKADGLTDPTATQKVTLGNSNGVETYSVTIDGTGTVSRLTVDQLGDPVTAPAKTTTTWATLDGTGTGSDIAAAAEILAIATAQSLTAPTSTTIVNVTTTSAGAISYTVDLTSSVTSTTTTDLPIFWHGFASTITVDAAGDPVGNQELPFSVFSSTIQNALNKNAPTGATPYAATSTQLVDVRTTDGVVTYSVNFTVTGTQSTVTVNSAGTLTSLPTTTTTTFSALSTALQTDLQTLATAEGVTTAIAGTQSVNMLTETNGTIIYSVTLSATGTDPAGNSYTFDVTIAVDSNGNPTTLPNDQGGFAHRGFVGICDPIPNANSSGGSTSNSSSGSNSSSTAISLPSGGSASATSITASASSASSYTLGAQLLADGEFALASLNGYLVKFAPLAVDAAVVTDALQLGTYLRQLGTDTRALTVSEHKTLTTDEKGIATAFKALKPSLAPLVSTLKSDASTWSKTLKADRLAVKRDRKNAAALATAESKLTADESAAFAAIVKDATAVTSAISSNAGVTAAQQQLATDLPTIGTDVSNIVTAQSQLISDL